MVQFDLIVINKCQAIILADNWIAYVLTDRRTHPTWVLVMRTGNSTVGSEHKLVLALYEW